MRIAVMLLVPGLGCIVVFFIMTILWSRKIRRDVLQTYGRNKELYYIQDYTTEEDYAALMRVEEKDTALTNEEEKDEGETMHDVTGYKVFDFFLVEGKRERKPRQTAGNQFEIKDVTRADIKAAESHRILLFGLELPKHVGFVKMISFLIVFPLFAIVWDFVDIISDTYYYVQFEMNDILDKNITRNPHVAHCMYAFTLLGAMKYVTVATCYMAVLKGNSEERSKRSLITRKTMFAISSKLLMEDAPQLLLEYFFVDKYVTINKPWFLVAKDAVSIVVYLLPLAGIVNSGYKNYKALREDDNAGVMMVVCYVLNTAARWWMSLAMISRVSGKIMQYSGSSIDSACFYVQDSALHQSPFDTDCVDSSDLSVLVCTGFSLVCACVPCVFFVCCRYKHYWC